MAVQAFTKMAYCRVHPKKCVHTSGKETQYDVSSLDGAAFTCGTLEDAGYCRKPTILSALREKFENAVWRSQ